MVFFNVSWGHPVISFIIAAAYILAVIFRAIVFIITTFGMKALAVSVPSDASYSSIGDIEVTKVTVSPTENTVLLDKTK